MAKKVALGKGLQALIPTIDDEADQQPAGSKRSKKKSAPAAGEVAEIKVSEVRPNPYQPRTEFDEDALDELAASIEQLGIIQPITVRALGSDQYELISGERRLRASRRAGLERIPAFIRKANTEEMLEMAIVENVQRENLNPVEVALGYQRLIDECDLTQEQVAKKVGKKRATVANFLRLLKLPPKVQAALRDQAISMGHARALITVDDKSVQVQILTDILENGLSVREVESKVRAWQLKKDAPESSKAAPSKLPPLANRDNILIQNFASQLRAHLSTQVHIKHKPNSEGGKVEIEYYSDEDLERLIELLIHS
ncbi:MAG: ParB/RepB/Spo0J family partition protein [Rhodothermaceae bacterium]|nr:ParB/RepB/Spo0J family partition protein [Rhodothermaceae bacterium]